MIQVLKKTALLAAASAFGAAAYAANVDVIATGLHNPRGLSFGDDGTLYVAEAGLGAGDGSGQHSAPGLGATGSIAAIINAKSPHPNVRRVVKDLASVSTPRGEVTGADGVSIRGDKMYIIETESTAAQLKNLLGGASALSDAQLDTVQELGKLLSADLREDSGEREERGHRNLVTIAAVGDINYAWTDVNQAAAFAPRGQFPDANPYAVLATRGREYVADAGANTIDEVLADGSVRIVAYLPNPPVSDAVPTCMAIGSDHMLYVGTLAFGANFAFGGGGATPQSLVYRFDPTSTLGVQFLTAANVWASGFFPITGCGFSGSAFYVTEFWTNLAPPGGGDVVKVMLNPDGTAGSRTHLGEAVLNTPNGFAAGADGAIYVSNHSTSEDGSVVRITP